MLNVLEYIVSVLKNDSQIQGYVGDRIFPTGVDITPEKSLFPIITFHTVTETTRSAPKGARDSVYQIDVFSILSQFEIENIAERILTLLNFTKFNTGYGTIVLRWQRQDAGVDMYESDRRIWHKSLRLRSWVK